MAETWGSAGEALAAAVVRVTDQHGEPVGAGFLVASDLVLTCAHVVSDALGLPREQAVEAGAGLTVGFPLVERPADGEGVPESAAVVEHWIPIRPDRTGDLAVLRLPQTVPGTHPLPMAEPGTVWNHEARAVGFTGGEPGEIWFRGRLSGATSEGWFQLSRASGQVTHIREGFSGSPVWDDELGAVVGLVVAAQREQEAQQAFVLHTRTLLRELPALAPVVSPASPFRGLATFREGDADVFFGRDDDIQDVITALRGTHSAVTLYGPSGCGKSSLALAGVAPRMRRDGHEVLVVDAGKVSSPRTALATVIHEAVRGYGPPRVSSADEVESLLGGKGLADTLHRVRGGAGAEPLVVLDQAEALLDRADAEIEEAVALLFPQHRSDGGTRVLLTLRADFMDAMLKHPRLGPAVRGGRTLPLTPMSRDQLAEVIDRPIERTPAVEYDPGLDRRILDDAGGEPGILPLLGFVLQELWDGRSGGRLRATAYEEMGGVLGALERHAEQAWQECVAGQPEREAEALRLLTGLVRVLPGSETPLRRRLTRQEAGEGRWRLARAFAARRLLVLHGDEGEPETAELAHEALITAWPALRDQVKADAEYLAARAELGHDLERWERGDRSADLLPAALHLASLHGRLGERAQELTVEEQDFLALARQRQRARRNRTRAAWTAIGVVFALIVGLGTFLVYQSRVSAEREEEGRSRALASFSSEAGVRNQGLGMLAAVAAYDISPTAEARSSLMRFYAAFKDTEWALSGAEGKIRAVATSNDGRVTLVTTRTGRATLFVRGADGRVLMKQLRLSLNATVPLVSRDGRRIAYLGDGVLYWHDVHRTARTAGRLLEAPHTVPGGGFTLASRMTTIDQDPAGTAAFSPDANRVATVSADGRLWLWDLEARRTRMLPARVTDAQSVWFGPDADTLVTVRGTGPSWSQSSVSAVDTGTGRARTLATGVDASQGVEGTGLSGDGSVLVACGRGNDQLNVYRAVRVADGKELSRYRADAGTMSCDGIAVDSAGERFATRKRNGAWLVVDARNGKATDTVGTTTGSVTGMPLLRSAGHSVVMAWAHDAVVGRPVRTDDVLDIAGPPVLLDDGDTMLAYEGKRGERLALIDLRSMLTSPSGSPEITAKVARGVPYEPDERSLSPAVNRAETLVADQVAPNRIVVRTLPSLREITEITTAMPPLDENEKRKELGLAFVRDELMTVSGSVIEQWNARDGRRTARAIDMHDLGLTDGESATFFARPHQKASYIQISVRGDTILHAVDRRTGKENRKLAVDFGDDYLTSVFTPDGRYAAVLTTGSLWEGWSVPATRRAKKVFGPVGPVEGNSGQMQLVGPSQVVLAIGNSVRFVHFTDLDRVDSYDFATDQYFSALSRDGRTFLRQMEGGQVDLFRLDPQLWKRHLCRILGRDLTADERRSLPSGLPDAICPA